jgi:hypothetical protein
MMNNENCFLKQCVSKNFIDNYKSHNKIKKLIKLKKELCICKGNEFTYTLILGFFEKHVEGFIFCSV